MRTILDELDYTAWATNAATIGFRSFRLELAAPNPDGAAESRNVVVEFDRALFVQALNEFACDLVHTEAREPHILARQTGGALIRWAREHTTLLDTDADERLVVHYSIHAADNVYHVLSDKEPRVYENRDAQPPA
jgi:hypothetical protein